MDPRGWAGRFAPECAVVDGSFLVRSRAKRRTIATCDSTRFIPVDSQRPRLAELRERIRLARAEKEQLAEMIADASTNALQKQRAVSRYNVIVGNLKGMASDLKSEIDASKRAVAERSRR